MEYIRGLEEYVGNKPSAISIGKFDGLHQGHELLVNRVQEHQKNDQVVGIILAFDMQPFLKKKNIRTEILLSNEEKAKLLEDRIDYFIDCPFDETIASMEAETFIENVISKTFHARYVVVGNDFRFGRERRGDYRMLQEYSEKYGYEVEVFEKKCCEGKEISSTNIKEELKKGNTDLAHRMLGRPIK